MRSPRRTQQCRVEAAEFESEKEGYVFKFDVYGLGYYKDEEASRPIEVTIDAIEADDVHQMAEQPSLINLVNLLLLAAIQSRTSDAE